VMVRLLEVNGIGSSHRKVVLKSAAVGRRNFAADNSGVNVPAINKKGPASFKSEADPPSDACIRRRIFVIDLAVQPLLWVLPSATRYLNQAPGLDRSAAIQSLTEEG
jgi:hypothetical protein